MSKHLDCVQTQSPELDAVCNHWVEACLICHQCRLPSDRMFYPAFPMPCHGKSLTDYHNIGNPIQMAVYMCSKKFYVTAIFSFMLRAKDKSLCFLVFIWRSFLLVNTAAFSSAVILLHKKMQISSCFLWSYNRGILSIWK